MMKNFTNESFSWFWGVRSGKTVFLNYSALYAAAPLILIAPAGGWGPLLSLCRWGRGSLENVYEVTELSCRAKT